MLEIIDPATGKVITQFLPEEHQLAAAFVRGTDFQVWASVTGATMQVA